MILVYHDFTKKELNIIGTVGTSTDGSKGWKKIKNQWYYINADGSYAKGWLNLNGTWYYMNENGVMQTGWVKSKDVWYYLNQDGAMATGGIKDNDKWYYLKDDGGMVTGFQNINGKWHSFADSGALELEWHEIYGYWYYTDSQGNVLTGIHEIKGTTYIFDNSGAMYKNTTIDGYQINDKGEVTKINLDYSERFNKEAIQKYLKIATAFGFRYEKIAADLFEIRTISTINPSFIIIVKGSIGAAGTINSQNNAPTLNISNGKLNNADQIIQKLLK
ncbi:MAG: hypothetical protein ACRC41_15180 [Sarcina sp.]